MQHGASSPALNRRRNRQSEEQLASYAREYIAKVENELQKIREGVLALTDKKLIPLPSTDESKAFYYKMKSDYHRYLAEQDTEVPKTSSRDRTLQRAAEQIPNVPVPETISRDGVQQRTVEQIVDAPVPQAVEELAEVSKVFSQDRIQQRDVEQTIENPAILLVEKIVEMPVTRKTQQGVNTHVQHVVNTVEVERPKLAKETVQEKINQVTKHIKIPQVQFLNKVDDMLVDVQQQIRPMAQTVQKTTEIPQLQFPDQVVDVPVVVQRQVPSIETVQKTVEVPQTQSIVKELRSKFEVGHTNEVRARNRSDKDAQEKANLTNQRQVTAIRSAQKTVEVPRVQYIDKVADIPVDVQRRGSPVQDTQHINEIEDVPDDPCLSETANEDRLEHENKKRKLPMPAEAVSESHADKSDFDRFEDLVLPSPEGKTLFVSIASGDEAEDESDNEQEMTRCLVQGGESMLVDETDAESPGHQMVQAVHADWAQELREERRKFVDDVASEMTDVKNELAHVREMVGVLVRRERSAETKEKLRPDDWTGWSGNNTKPTMPSTKPTFRRPLRISRRP